MSTINKLTQFYDKILMSLNCTIDENTREIYLSYEGEDTPVYIQRKRLIAISSAVIREGINNDTHVAFHPLSESATAGMSEVHQWIMMAINLRLNTYLMDIVSRIADIASNETLQAQMKPSEVSQYKSLTDVDSKLVNSVSDLIDRLDVRDRNQTLLHIRCKRSGVLAGKNYGRVTYITFPILNELEEGLVSGVVYGKSMRKKDIRALLVIFKEIILNNRTDVTDFSSGNTTTSAPYLSSMLTAFNNVLVRLNSLQRSQGSLLKPTGLPADTSWYPEISGFANLQKAAPQLEGNVGTTSGITDTVTRRVTDRMVETSEEDINDVSGINHAIETPHQPQQQSSGSIFKAIPFREGAAKIIPTTSFNNNPLNVSVQPIQQASEMTVDQYMQMQAYHSGNNYGGNNTGVQQTFRGRDAYTQRKQMETLGYNTGGYPVVQQYHQPVNNQQQNHPKLTVIDGQLVQIIPVQQQTVQNHQPSPVSSPAGMFENFAR
jgi:hypothetical protein